MKGRRLFRIELYSYVVLDRRMVTAGWVGAHLMVELTRPDGLDDGAWQAISAYVARLRRAIDERDGAQVVGYTKELTESVAKVVLTARGTMPAGDVKYKPLIAQAHVALARQPGEELSGDPVLNRVAGSFKTLAIELGEIRNTYGTGHGRAEELPVAEEMAEMCCGGAVLWCRWALRRLQPYLEGVPERLVSDLDAGEIFTRGALTRRLRAADLPNTDAGVVRRIGLAVGQRAARDTINVQDDGIRACALADDPQVWPSAYREGAFEGLFLTSGGQRTLKDFNAEWAARVIAPLPDPALLISELTTKVAVAPPREIRETPQEYELYRRLWDSGSALPQPVAAVWRDFADVFDPTRGQDDRPDGDVQSEAENS